MKKVWPVLSFDNESGEWVECVCSSEKAAVEKADELQKLNNPERHEYKLNYYVLGSVPFYE